MPPSSGNQLQPGTSTISASQFSFVGRMEQLLQRRDNGKQYKLLNYCVLQLHTACMRVVSPSLASLCVQASLRQHGSIHTVPPQPHTVTPQWRLPAVHCRLFPNSSRWHSAWTLRAQERLLMALRVGSHALVTVPGSDRRSIRVDACSSKLAVVTRLQTDILNLLHHVATDFPARDTGERRCRPVAIQRRPVQVSIVYTSRSSTIRHGMRIYEK